MSSNPIVFWEINAHDGEKLSAFYNSVFDWSAEADENGFFSVQSVSDEGKGITGGIFTGKGQIPPHRALYVPVDSAAETLEKVRAAGGKVMLKPFEGPGGNILAFFEDPEGHTTGVIQRKEQKEN